MLNLTDGLDHRSDSEAESEGGHALIAWWLRLCSFADSTQPHRSEFDHRPSPAPIHPQACTAASVLGNGEKLQAGSQSHHVLGVDHAAWIVPDCIIANFDIFVKRPGATQDECNAAIADARLPFECPSTTAELAFPAAAPVGAALVLLGWPVE